MDGTVDELIVRFLSGLIDKLIDGLIYGMIYKITNGFKDELI